MEYIIVIAVLVKIVEWLTGDKGTNGPTNEQMDVLHGGYDGGE